MCGLHGDAPLNYKDVSTLVSIYRHITRLK